MRCVIAMFLLAVGMNAQAEQTWQEKCTTISTFAKSVMKAHQIGVPLSEIMSKLKDSPEVVQSIALQAYEQPRFNTQQIQDRTIGDFADKWYRICAKAYVK